MRAIIAIGLAALIGVSCASMPAAAGLPAAVSASAAAGASAVAPERSAQKKLQIVTSTQVLADMVRQVAADAANVQATVPEAADPKYYDPLPRDLQRIALADIAFYNYAQYEDPRISAAYRAKSGHSVELASEAIKHEANLIQLVSDTSLNAVWLGLRAQTPQPQPQARIEFSATGMQGPGDLHAYVVGSFGEPKLFWSSADGFNRADGYAADTTVLTHNGHTHLSWAFTKPGIYKLRITAKYRAAKGERAREIASGEITFAVGVDPQEVAAKEDREIIDGGHFDITADVAKKHLFFSGEVNHAAGEHGSHAAHTHSFEYALREAVVAVPTRTLKEVPGQNYDFLGAPGTQVYQLPQAVLGRTIHGEIDPHLLQDPQNGRAYVAAIAEHLSAHDPAKAAIYHANAAAYSERITELAQRLRQAHADYTGSRQLITSGSEQNYFASSFGYQIAAATRRNPAVEPGIADYKRLATTLGDLKPKAVFIGVHKSADDTVLKQLAQAQQVPSCQLYDQSLDSTVRSYLELLAHNSETVLSCLEARQR